MIYTKKIANILLSDIRQYYRQALEAYQERPEFKANFETFINYVANDFHDNIDLSYIPDWLKVQSKKVRLNIKRVDTYNAPTVAMTIEHNKPLTVFEYRVPVVYRMTKVHKDTCISTDPKSFCEFDIVSDKALATYPEHLTEFLKNYYDMQDGCDKLTSFLQGLDTGTDMEEVLIRVPALSFFINRNDLNI